MRRLTLLILIIILISCGKKSPQINWEKNRSLQEVINIADGKFIMLDFVKDG